MTMNLIRQILAAPRRLYLAISATCLGMLAFGVLYLQGMVGLQPCPMCIVQREALIAVAVFSALAAACKPGGWQRGFGVLALLFAVLGAFTGGRQSWLQWNPPAFSACGRGDLYGMIESMPIGRLLPSIFKGSGDCAAVDWTLLGGSIANWSFMWFAFCTVLLLALALRRKTG